MSCIGSVICFCINGSVNCLCYVQPSTFDMTLILAAAVEGSLSCACDAAICFGFGSNVRCMLWCERPLLLWCGNSQALLGCPYALAWFIHLLQRGSSIDTSLVCPFAMTWSIHMLQLELSLLESGFYMGTGMTHPSALAWPNHVLWHNFNKLYD